MGKDLVSIVVPVYNSEKYILKCLESLVKQTYQNIEIIVINDGSNDNSLDLINEFSSHHSNIKIIDKVNTGVSDTRNIGIDVATGEFLMFVDADDWIQKEAVQSCIDNIGNLEVLRFISLKVSNQSAELCPCKYNNTPDRIIEASEMFDDLIRDKMPGHCWSFFYRANLLKKHNIRFDENLVYCEDVVFVFNLLKYCTKIKLLNQPLYNYFKENNYSATSNIKNIIRNLKTMPLIREGVIRCMPSSNKISYIKIYNYTQLGVIKHYYWVLSKELSYKLFKEEVSQINVELDKLFKEIDLSGLNFKWKTFIKCNIKNRYLLLFIGFKINNEIRKLRKRTIKIAD